MIQSGVGEMVMRDLKDIDNHCYCSLFCFNVCKEHLFIQLAQLVKKTLHVYTFP